MNSSVLSLDGNFGEHLDPFELPPSSPSPPRRVKPPKSKKNRNPEPLPSNPRPGDCACRWNGKKQRWTKLCFVGKGSGKGMSRSGWIIKKDTGNTCSPTTRTR